MADSDLFEQLASQQAARTARLIGGSEESRLRWLLKFAATDTFEEMPSSKFERLRREVGAFADLGASSFQTADNPVSPEAAQRLALTVRDGVRAYAHGASWNLPRMSIARSVIPKADRPSYNGPWDDAFLMSAADVLQSVGSLLRICPAHACAVLFVKHKRKIYCSEKCSGRERMRRFQQNAARYKAKRRRYYLKSLERRRPDFKRPK